MVEEHLGNLTPLRLCPRKAQNKSYFYFCEIRDENWAEIHQNENNFCSRRRVDTNSALFYPRGAPLSFPLGYFVEQTCLGSVWFGRRERLFARKRVFWAGLVSKFMQLLF